MKALVPRRLRANLAFRCRGNPLIRNFNLSPRHMSHLKHEHFPRQFYSKDRLLWTLLAGFGFAVFASSDVGAESESAEAKYSPGQNSSATVVEDTYKIPESPDLPFFTREEISLHNGRNGSAWVTYQNGVYDVTEWIDLHPGGRDKVLLAAGGPLEPYWAIYGNHRVSDVREILERYRIGNCDPLPPSASTLDASDPYFGEPSRHPALVVIGSRPFNAETPRAFLTDLVTPNEFFFVRNHMPVPPVDEQNYTLTVDTDGGTRSLTYNLNDLKNEFEPHEVVMTIQCAGNRRSDMHRDRAVVGGQWDIGAISTAEWQGVRLTDVLQKLGVDPRDYEHVQFQGMDHDGSVHYGASIPMPIALNNDVILAYKMNGTDIPVDHGHPLRAIVPGVIGARNVKWLEKITLSNDESSSHWQQRDYKSFSPSMDASTADYGTASAIQEYPVQSAVVSPNRNDVVQLECDNGTAMLPVKGYAWSGGGREIIRVDVTMDGGRSWHEAALEHPEGEGSRKWAWTQWQADVPLSCETGECVRSVEVACRAWDRSYNTQPETFGSIWNFRGLLSNAWHRVPLVVTGACRPDSDMI